MEDNRIDKNKEEVVGPVKSEAKTNSGQAADETQMQDLVKPEVGIEVRIEQLRSSINDAKCGFKTASKKLLTQICIWGFVNLLIIAGAIIYGVYLHQHSILKDTWTWQVIYYTVLRVTILGAIFSFGAYCLKLLSSHIFICIKVSNIKELLLSLYQVLLNRALTLQKGILFSIN